MKTKIILILTVAIALAVGFVISGGIESCGPDILSYERATVDGAETIKQVTTERC